MSNNIVGDKAMYDFLQTLPAKIEKNIMRAAMRAGAVKYADKAKQLVPVNTGALQKSIRVTTDNKGGQVNAYAKAGGKGAYHAHLVEFGTKPHKIPNVRIGRYFYRAVQHPGAKKRPFMRPAYDAATPQAIEATAEMVRKRLTKAGLEIPPQPGD